MSFVKLSEVEASFQLERTSTSLRATIRKNLKLETKNKIKNIWQNGQKEQSFCLLKKD